jgi:hypothetical protein
VRGAGQAISLQQDSPAPYFFLGNGNSTDPYPADHPREHGALSKRFFHLKVCQYRIRPSRTCTREGRPFSKSQPLCPISLHCKGSEDTMPAVTTKEQDCSAAKCNPSLLILSPISEKKNSELTYRTYHCVYCDKPFDEHREGSCRKCGRDVITQSPPA